MPAKKTISAAGAGAVGGSRSKKAAGLGQPTLSFKARKPTAHSDKSKSKTKITDALSRTPSTSEIEDVHDIPPPRAPAPIKANTVTEKDVGAAAPSVKRRQLDVKSKEWNGLTRDAKAAMGGLTPIHAGPETHDNIHHILRVFDMTSKYGPCVGITRLQRWERAKKWGLSPPDQIRDILTTEQGEDNVSYRENVLHGWV